MWEFIKFWWECLGCGFELGDGLIWKIEGFLTIVVPVLRGIIDTAIKVFKWLRRPKGESASSDDPSGHPGRLEKLWHRFENKITKASVTAGILMFLFTTACVAPFVQYKDEKEKSANEIRRSENLQKEIDDKSPKLNGSIIRTLVANEPGTSNSLVFIEINVDNNGGAPSYAEDYSLKVILSKTASTNASEINFAGEYKVNMRCDGKLYLLDLKRSELIAEKTIKAIEPGNPARGWAAFRLKGVLSSRYDPTNLVLSFRDINRKQISTTNSLSEAMPCSEAFAKIIPGSDNIFLQIEPVTSTNHGWLPPELPPGCSNVTVFFGAMGIGESRQFAEISDTGTRFAIKDVPDYFLQNSDKMPGYSPRQQYMWIKSGETKFAIGGKNVTYPIQPVIVSNRLYIEVAIPFTNEKRKLVMSDAFDAELSPLPLNWDRNFSTNYDEDTGIYAYEIVNEITNPVLQVVYTAPNEVHVEGIFQVDSNSILAAFGEQPILGIFNYGVYDPTNGTMTASLQMENFHESLMLHSNESLASFGQRFTNEFFRPIFKYQRPIFKYPSNRNPGAFSEWAWGTNNNDTNLIDKTSMKTLPPRTDSKP